MIEEPDGLEAAATPLDYADREGFDEGFLGERVRLPGLIDGDVLRFEDLGTQTDELKYTHFSVKMSAARKLCRYSAVNIEGTQSSRADRPGRWLIDPRIDREEQTIDSVYGSAPKFSRGHMTRREDPIWGDEDTAQAGNRDSMHYTNVVPQMQPFNAPVWLALENYALQHARQDRMRISVMTGPFLEPADPVRYGVQVPEEFWKLIAFIHDRTGKLTCTGYSVSQKDFLSPLEFVFGEFKTYQLPVATIERRARLDLHGLSAHDPLDGEEAALLPLTELAQIQFVR